MKTKRAHAAPAADLYTSPLFVGRRSFVESSCDEWFVLSAKHRLLDPDEVTEPYDVTLADLEPSRRSEWSRQVLAQLTSRFGTVAGVTFEIHAGAAYRNGGLVEGLRQAGATVEIPAEGLNQGQQLAFYRTGNSTTSKPSGGTYAPLQLLLTEVEENRITLSFSELEAVLGRALPASARVHRPWWANSDRTPQAGAWMGAGWRVAGVDRAAEHVEFERSASTAKTSPVEATSVGPIRTLLTDPARPRPVREVKRNEHTSAGLYSWWADEEARQIIGAALGVDVPPLVYIGQAGATKQPSGTASNATLGSRVAGQHATGNISSSTFRLTISAILSTTVDLASDGKGALTRESNAIVSDWIAEHLQVAIVDIDDRDTLGVIEAEIVASVNPPLNLDHVPPTDHRRRLRALRQQLRATSSTALERAAMPAATAAPNRDDWLLRIEPVALTTHRAQRTSPAALHAVARLAEQLPAIRQALSRLPAGPSSGIRVVFSPAVQRALETGSLSLMGSGADKLTVAVNSAGKIVQIGRVAPTGVGAAGVAAVAAPPLWPVVVAGGLALAASYAEQRWLEQTFAELRQAMERLEHRMRDDDAGALAAADTLVSLLAPDGHVGAIPEQLRIELALARRQVDAVYLARRRFVDRFKRALETAQTEHEARTGQRAAWVGKVTDELADRRTGVVDELVLFLQAMIARARLGAITASVLAVDGDSGHAVRLLASIEDEMRTDYFDLHNRIAALARGERAETAWGRMRGIAGKRLPMLASGTDDEGVEMVRAIDRAMRETVGAAMPERDRMVDLIVPVDELLQLDPAS